MTQLPELFANDRRWAERVESGNPRFFAGRATVTAPTGSGVRGGAA